MPSKDLSKCINVSADVGICRRKEFRCSSLYFSLLATYSSDFLISPLPLNLMGTIQLLRGDLGAERAIVLNINNMIKENWQTVLRKQFTWE